VSPNVAWSGSLESYHSYQQAKKVSKIPKIECIHSGLPKTAKSHFGCLDPLGVKWVLSLFSRGIQRTKICIIWILYEYVMNF
jgi:hypothetical protein